jgi:hypothetical protein
MGVHGAAKVGHAGIVVRREVVSDNQADNPQWKIDPSIKQKGLTP